MSTEGQVTGRRGRWLLVAGAPLLVMVALLLIPRNVDVWIDNGSEAAVDVTIGHEAFHIEAHSTVHAKVDAGFQTLTGPSGEFQADLRVDSFGPARNYVWNVGGHASYWRVGRRFNAETVAVQPKPERFVPEGEVFVLPVDVLPSLNQALPEEIRVKKGQSEGTRFAVWSSHYAAIKTPSTQRVIVDNTGMANLELRLDGEAKGQVAPGGIYMFESLGKGEHTFAAIERGSSGAAGRTFEHSLSVTTAAFEPKTYVWAPGNPTPSYAIVAQTYGKVDSRPSTVPYTSDSSWFELPEGLYSLNAFPETATPEPGATGVVVRSLWTQRAYDAFQLKPQLQEFAEGIQPYQMGELGEKIMEQQRKLEEAKAMEAEEAGQPVEEGHEGHDHAPGEGHGAPPRETPTLPPLRPGDLNPDQLFPPR